MSAAILREKIVKRIDKIKDWFLYNSLKREKDPRIRLEKKIWMEIRGSFLGGMAGDTAWANYKVYYYDKLSSEEDKQQVHTSLLNMLKSGKYSVLDKSTIAYICADIGIKEAVQDINFFLQRSQDKNANQLFLLAMEALTKGVAMKALLGEKYLKREKS